MTIAYKKPENVTLMTDDEVTASAKLSRTAPGRLKVGETYEIIGACKVAPSGRIANEWEGILISTLKGKAFPVSVNTLVGIGFYRSNPSDETQAPVIRRVSSQIFEDASEVLAHKDKRIQVIKNEALEITNFDRENVTRDFPVLRKL